MSDALRLFGTERLYRRRRWHRRGDRPDIHQAGAWCLPSTVPIAAWKHTFARCAALPRISAIRRIVKAAEELVRCCGCAGRAGRHRINNGAVQTKRRLRTATRSAGRISRQKAARIHVMSRAALRIWKKPGRRLSMSVAMRSAFAKTAVHLRTVTAGDWQIYRTLAARPAGRHYRQLTSAGRHHDAGKPSRIQREQGLA